MSRSTTATVGRNLAVALSSGGTYADLYFEHRTTSSILFEEESVKSAGGGVTQGVGIRVVAGDARSRFGPAAGLAGARLRVEPADDLRAGQSANHRQIRRRR